MPRRDKLNSISTSLWEPSRDGERERPVWMRGEAKIEWEVKKWEGRARERSKVRFARGFTAKWKQHIFFPDSTSHIVACWISFGCNTPIVHILYKFCTNIHCVLHAAQVKGLTHDPDGTIFTLEREQLLQHCVKNITEASTLSQQLCHRLLKRKLELSHWEVEVYVG